MQRYSARSGGRLRVAIGLFFILGLFVGVMVVPLSGTIYGEAESPRWEKAQLYFGLSKPGGGGVSISEWEAFQREVIDSRFKGYNLSDSLGYWEGSPERSKVLMIILKAEDTPKVKEIAREYARRFDQESVLLVKTPIAELEFIKQR